MGIIDKFKRVLATKEARSLKREITKQTKHKASQAKDVASSAYQATKEKASDVVEKAADVVGGKINYDAFKKIEVRVGTILSVEKIEKSDKLLKLMVNVGEYQPRQIVSGIAPYFTDINSLVGRQAMFVTNLEPRKIFGLESNGMIFAVNDESSFSILEPDHHVKEGTLAS